VAAFERLKKIQNGGHCHGNQGAKNVNFTNRNGRNMVQHILLPVNIHFH
jgi:hypothetical protein